MERGKIAPFDHEVCSPADNHISDAAGTWLGFPLVPLPQEHSDDLSENREGKKE